MLSDSSAAAAALASGVVGSTIVRQHGQSNHQWADQASIGAQRRVRHLARIDVHSSRRLSVSGCLRVKAAAIHLHLNQDGFFPARRQLETWLADRSLPEHLATLRHEGAQLEFHVSFTTSVVLKRDWNRTHFVAARVFHHVRASDAAGTVAIVLVLVTATPASAIVVIPMTGAAVL